MIKPSRKITKPMELQWTKHNTAWTINPPVRSKPIPGDQYQSQFDVGGKVASIYPSIEAYDSILEQYPDIEIPKEIEEWYFGQSIIFRQQQKFIAARDQFYDYEMPSNNVTLYPHQRHTIEFLKHNDRAMCFDEVGLGKTVSTLVALTDKIDRKQFPIKIVIVVLGKLQKQWSNEVAQWFGFPSTEFNICNRAKRTRENLWAEFLQNADNISIAYVNWEALKLLNLNWEEVNNIQYLIADEAQALRNRKSKQTIAFKQLADKSKVVWMLTGTPLEKAPHELWSLLNILNPRWFRSYWNFFNSFVDFELTGAAGYITPVGVREESKPVLHEILQKYSVRHTRLEEFADLKEVQRIYIPVSLTRQQKALYKELKTRSYIERLKLVIPHGAARLLRMRQVINCPTAIDPGIKKPEQANAKIETVQELLSTIPDANQVIIFCSFIESLRLLERTCIAIPYYSEDPDKEEILQEFQAGEFQVLACTPQSLGTGANLQNANVIIYFDVPISSLQYKQGIGRIDRIGQQKIPLVYHLIAEDTVDEVIHQMLQQKEIVFDETILTNAMLKQIQENES